MQTFRQAHQSTSPGEWVIQGNLAGNPIAQAVLESYRVPFWASSVIVMSPAEFDAEVRRGQTSFAFEHADDCFMVAVPSALDGPEPITVTVSIQPDDRPDEQETED
jgi:hypothetical protein